MSSAHNYVEYEEMLKSFRCQDLANLLAFAGQSKNGKKSELLERCINILKKGNAGIQLKIREIHNSRISSTTVASYSNLISGVNSGSCSSTSNSPDPTLFGGSNRFVNPSSNPPSLGNFSNPNQYPYNQQLFPMASGGGGGGGGGGQPLHQNLLLQNQQLNNGNGIARNPNPNAQFNNGQPLLRIQYEKLAFYEYLYEISSPVRMLGTVPTQRPLSMWFNFFLNTEQVNAIIETREMIGGKLEYSKQIHLRFGFYEHTSQRDALPPNLILNINGKPAQLPTPKPTSKPNADIIRPGRSIDVTSICRLAPNIANKVELSWTNLENNKAHCVGVYLFRKVSVDSLIENLKKNCTKEAELTRKMVREKLQISDSDFEIETNTYKVSLHCPLMKFRLKLPGRSFKCKHVQCFDVESYLMMNEKKPTWNCPVCDQYVPYDTLIIDSLFIEILEKAKGLEEVQFNADAEWSKVIDDKSANNNNNNTSSSKNNKEVNSQDNSLGMNDNDNSATKKIKTDDDALVDLIDLDESLNRSSQGTTKNTNELLTTENQPKKVVEEFCIDLTIDSDDEVEQSNKNIQTTTTATTSSSRITAVNPSNFSNTVNNRISARTNSQSSTNSNFSGVPFNEGVYSKNLFEGFANSANLNSVNMTSSNDIRKNSISSRNNDQHFDELQPSSPNDSIISLSSDDDSNRCQTPQPENISKSSSSTITNNVPVLTNTTSSILDAQKSKTPGSNSSNSSSSSGVFSKSSPSSFQVESCSSSTTTQNTIHPTSTLFSNSEPIAIQSKVSLSSNFNENQHLSPRNTSSHINSSPSGHNSSFTKIQNTNSASNSRLARDLSMPSPNKTNAINSVDVNMSDSSEDMPNSSPSSPPRPTSFLSSKSLINKQPSLASLNSIIENTNKLSPSRPIATSASSSSIASSSSYSNQTSYSPTNKTSGSNAYSNTTPSTSSSAIQHPSINLIRKLSNSSNSNTFPMPNLSTTNSKPHQSVNSITNDPSKAFNQNPSGIRNPNQLQQQQHHQYQQLQQQQQRTNIATKASNSQQQRPQQIPVTNKSSMVNSNNRISNAKLPHRQPEYINKDKALLIQNELSINANLKNPIQQQPKQANPNYQLKANSNIPSSSLHSNNTNLVNQNRNVVPPQNVGGPPRINPALNKPLANTPSLSAQQLQQHHQQQQSNINRNPAQTNRPIQSNTNANIGNKIPNQLAPHPSQQQIQQHQQQQRALMTAAQLQGNPNNLLKSIGQTQSDRKQPPTNPLSSNNSNPFSNNKQASSSSSMISPNKITNNSQNQPFFLNQPFTNKTHPHQNNGMPEGVSNTNDMSNRQFNSSSSSSSRMNQQQHFINQQPSSSHHQQSHGNRQSPYSTSPPVVNHSQNNQANSQLSHLINQNNHNQMQKNMLGSSTGLSNNSNSNASRIMQSHQQIQHHASHHQPAHSLIQNQSINR